MPEQDQRSTRIARELFMLSFLGGDPTADVESIGSAASKLAGQMVDVYFRAGDILYRQGDRAEGYFFIVEGRVELVKPGAPPWTFDSGSLVGALDIMHDRARSRTATAVTDVHALRLPASAWFDTLEDNFELARGSIRNVARGVHELLAGAGGDSAPAVTPEACVLPPAPMNLVEKILVLRATVPFRDAHMQTVTVLADVAEELRLAPGDAVFEGDAAIAFCFVVAAGQVALRREAPTPLSFSFGASEMVSAPATFAGELGAYTARATVPTVVLRLRLEDVYDAMEEHFDFVRATMLHLSTLRERMMNVRAALPT